MIRIDSFNKWRLKEANVPYFSSIGLILSLSLSVLFIVLSFGVSNAVSFQVPCTNLTFTTTATLSQNLDANSCWIIIDKNVTLTLANYNITAKGIINNGTIIFTSQAYDIMGMSSFYNPAHSVLNISDFVNYGTTYLQEPILNVSNVYNYGIINDTLISRGYISCAGSPVAFKSSYAGSGGGGTLYGNGFVGSGGAGKVGLVIKANVFYNNGSIYDTGLDASPTAFNWCSILWSTGGDTLATGGNYSQNGTTPPQTLLSFTQNFSLLNSAGGGWGLQGDGGSGGPVVEIVHKLSHFKLGIVNVSGGRGFGGGGSGGSGQVFVFYKPFPTLNFTSTLLYNCRQGLLINKSLTPVVKLMLPGSYENITGVYKDNSVFSAYVKDYTQDYALFNFTAPGYSPEYQTILAAYSNNTFTPVSDRNLIWYFDDNQSETLNFAVYLNGMAYTKYSKIEFNRVNYTTDQNDTIAIPSFSGQPYSYKIWFYWGGSYVSTNSVLSQSPYFDPCDPATFYNYTRYVSYNETEGLATLNVTASSFPGAYGFNQSIKNLTKELNALEGKLAGYEAVIGQIQYSYGRTDNYIKNLSSLYTLNYDRLYNITKTTPAQNGFSAETAHLLIINSSGNAVLDIGSIGNNKTYTLTAHGGDSFVILDGASSTTITLNASNVASKNTAGALSSFIQKLSYPFLLVSRSIAAFFG